MHQSYCSLLVLPAFTPPVLLVSITLKSLWFYRFPGVHSSTHQLAHTLCVCVCVSLSLSAESYSWSFSRKSTAFSTPAMTSPSSLVLENSWCIFFLYSVSPLESLPWTSHPRLSCAAPIGFPNFVPCTTLCWICPCAYLSVFGLVISFRRELSLAPLWILSTQHSAWVAAGSCCCGVNEDSYGWIEKYITHSLDPCTNTTSACSNLRAL